MLETMVGLGRFVDFLVRVLVAVPGTLLRRGRSLPREFERVALGSLPLVAAAGVSVGMVTWMQTRRQLERYELEAALPSLLTVAVFVETGPLLAALLVAGRMGAGLGAELASMGLTEEIDAREVLGAATVPTLVAPRALACALALPLLTIWIDAAAFGGGLLAEMTAGSLTAELFGRRALDYLRLVDVVPATLKTAVFGFLIGAVGCWVGLRADRSTEAVGRAATQGVVLASLAVFLANVLLVPWLQWGVEALGWTG